MINNGVIVASNENVEMRVHYDASQPASLSQPLIDGPRGWCLELVNATGKNTRVTLSLPDGTEQTITIGRGDPVTSGPAQGRSRTAAQMATLGFRTRGDVTGVTGPY